MQIIEFNGLPGTGKTTIANNLIRSLENKGYICIRKYGQGSLLSFCYRCLRFPSCLRLLYLLIKFQRTLSTRASNWRIALLVIHFYQTYLLFERRKGEAFYIVDQGIIQGIISMAHTNEISNVDLLKSIVSIISRNILFWRMDCITNEDISFDRIRSRTPAGSRLEQFDDNDLHEALRIQSINFDIVRKVFSSQETKRVIELNTEDSIEMNVIRILKLINE